MEMSREAEVREAQGGKRVRRALAVAAALLKHPSLRMQRLVPFNATRPPRQPSMMISELPSMAETLSLAGNGARSETLNSHFNMRLSLTEQDPYAYKGLRSLRSTQ